MPKQLTLESAMDLIAGAAAPDAMRAIIQNLQAMEAGCNPPDPDKLCTQLIAALQQGYYNWTGEYI